MIADMSFACSRMLSDVPGACSRMRVDVRTLSCVAAHSTGAPVARGTLLPLSLASSGTCWLRRVPCASRGLVAAPALASAAQHEEDGRGRTEVEAEA